MAVDQILSTSRSFIKTIGFANLPKRFQNLYTKVVEKYKKNKNTNNRVATLVLKEKLKAYISYTPLNALYENINIKNVKKTAQGLNNFYKQYNENKMFINVPTSIKKKVSDYNKGITEELEFKGKELVENKGMVLIQIIKYIFKKIKLDNNKVNMVKVVNKNDGGGDNLIAYYTITEENRHYYIDNRLEKEHTKYDVSGSDPIQDNFGSVDGNLKGDLIYVKFYKVAKNARFNAVENFEFAFSDDEDDDIMENEGGNYKEYKSGAFFRFITQHRLSGIDLTRYQIYNIVSGENYEENCLIHSLLMGLGNKWLEVVNHLKSICRHNMIPKKFIKKIALDHDLCITIRYINCRNDTYNKEGKTKVNLGLIDGHYFIIDDRTNITTYAINNYEKVKEYNNWNRIHTIGGNGKPRYVKENEGSDSFLVIKNLYENHLKCREENRLQDSLLKEITVNEDLLKSVNYGGDMKIDSLAYSENILKKIEYQEKEAKYKYRCNFDFETCPDENKIHMPYLVNYRLFKMNETKDEFKAKLSLVGKDCSLRFLQSLQAILNKETKGEKGPIKVCIMAHNISYDIQFLVRYLKRYNPTHRSTNSICGGSGYFSDGNNQYLRSLKIYFKCSYAVIPKKLSAFSSMFGLKSKKEIMPYGIYNTNNSYDENNKYNVNDCFHVNNNNKYDNSLLNEKDRNEFIDNIEKWNLWANEEKTQFYHVKYSKMYCEMDVLVMSKGYEIFKKWIKDAFNMNVDNYPTICSLADAYLKKEGCYDDCYYMAGVPMIFINKAMRGGRCMTRKNKKYHTLMKLNDFDAVSLYPSAMYRMEGFLKGSPKVLSNEQLNKNFLDSVSGYFVQIKINKVNKKLALPVISIIDKDGNRLNTDNVDLLKDSEIIVDKTTLEDWIEFQQIEYTVVKGYYFNEGRNKKINEVILTMFNNRLKFKKEGNKIEEVYKLMMNSAYGKSLLKPQDTKYVYKDSKADMMNYLVRNYNFIKESQKYNFCDKYRIEVKKPINEHLNAVHIGVEILSMSKRITNEVMVLAEDLNIKIYYTDTDSMHIENDKIQLLSDKFKEKYNRDLIGSNMGQFHNDFEPHYGKNADYAVESVFLRKKIYCDKVQYNVDGEMKYSYHYRMKGIPQNVIMKYAEDNYNGEIMNLYKDLYDGKEIEFNLLSCGVRFQMTKNMIVFNKQEMHRKISLS